MKKISIHFFLAGFFSLLLIISSCETSEDKTGCDCETTKTAQDQITVGPSNISDDYSTYEANNDEFDADGSCHADMSLVFRWADNAIAKTITQILNADICEIYLTPEFSNSLTNFSRSPVVKSGSKPPTTYISP